MKNVVKNEDISYEAKGVGRINGKVVFVPFTIVGEEVEFEVDEENSRFISGKLKRVIEQNEKRILPKCPYFKACGGCDFQHMEYDEELKNKKRYISCELKKCGNVDNFKIITGKNRFNYRNKIKLVAKGDKLGFVGCDGKSFVEIKHCDIADEKLNDSLKFVQESGVLKRLTDLKNVILRKINEEIIIVFLFEKENVVAMQNLTETFSGLKTNVFVAFGRTFESNNVKIKKIVSVNDSINETVCNSFLQVNDEVAKKLYKEVCQSVTGKNVINAYSGAGELSMLLAKNAKFVCGVEMNENAHKRAERLKGNEKIQNLFNYLGKCEDVIPKITSQKRFDSIVLDPARAGAHKDVLEVIKKSQINECVYVSCNPATLARDLKVLTDKVFRIDKILAYDMFPCTKNIEILAILKRNFS